MTLDQMNQRFRVIEDMWKVGSAEEQEEYLAELTDMRLELATITGPETRQCGLAASNGGTVVPQHFCGAGPAVDASLNSGIVRSQKAAGGRRLVSPGPEPGSSGTIEYSRKAPCRACRPSRNAAACGPRSGNDACSSPASAVISVLASSRSRWTGFVGVLGGQAELLGGRRHQHDRRPADHLNRRDVDQVAIFESVFVLIGRLRRLSAVAFGGR